MRLLLWRAGNRQQHVDAIMQYYLVMPYRLRHATTYIYYVVSDRKRKIATCELNQSLFQEKLYVVIDFVV